MSIGTHLLIDHTERVKVTGRSYQLGIIRWTRGQDAAQTWPEMEAERTERG